MRHKEITNFVLKSYYEVYNELGEGFLESVYENALSIVLEDHGLAVERQKPISVISEEIISAISGPISL